MNVENVADGYLHHQHQSCDELCWPSRLENRVWKSVQQNQFPRLAGSFVVKHEPIG